MKPLCIPTHCPVCRTELVEIDSSKYSNPSVICPENCFSIYKGSDDKLATIRIVNHNEWQCYFWIDRLELGIRPYKPQSYDYGNVIMFPYTWFDLTNFTALEKKIKMLLTFS